MKITVEKNGRVDTIETNKAIVLAHEDEKFLSAVEGTLVDLGALLGLCEPIAENWDALSKMVAIAKMVKACEDATAGKGARQ